MRVSDFGPQTETIDMDEKCLGVMEAELASNDFMEVHRYRLTWVIRDHAPEIYSEIIVDFPDGHPPIQFPIDGEHTVGEAWNIIDKFYGRENTRARLKELAEESAQGGIIDAMIDRAEQKKLYVERNPRTIEAIERFK